MMIWLPADDTPVAAIECQYIRKDAPKPFAKLAQQGKWLCTGVQKVLTPHRIQDKRIGQ